LTAVTQVLTFGTPLTRIRQVEHFPIPQYHPLGCPNRRLLLKILIPDAKRAAATLSFAYPSILSPLKVNSIFSPLLKSIIGCFHIRLSTLSGNHFPFGISDQYSDFLSNGFFKRLCRASRILKGVFSLSHLEVAALDVDIDRLQFGVCFQSPLAGYPSDSTFSETTPWLMIIPEVY
jgi:hypothetical protein